MHTKGVTTIRKSEDRQHNPQKTKNRRENNDLQNTTEKITRTPLKPRVNSGAPKGLAVFVPLVAPILLL